MLLALTRAVPSTLANAQLTYLERRPIDVARARAEHEAYEEALRDAGCTVMRVPPADDMPDSVFIEDTAVVLDEIAVITRPGAESRRGETEAVAAVLQTMRPLERIVAPGTLDGGDVLRLGRTLYVGRSTRTNDHAIEQLRSIVRRFGYRVEGVEVGAALHLKSAISAVDANTVIANLAAVDVASFSDFDVIAVAEGEEEAANVLRVGEHLLVPAAAPRTIAILESRGDRVTPVEQSELAKAEAGLTCSSLIFER